MQTDLKHKDPNDFRPPPNLLKNNEILNDEPGNINPENENEDNQRENQENNSQTDVNKPTSNQGQNKNDEWYEAIKLLKLKWTSGKKYYLVNGKMTPTQHGNHKKTHVEIRISDFAIFAFCLTFLPTSKADEQRINYGVIFKNQPNIDFATDYWTHIYEIPMYLNLQHKLVTKCPKAAGRQCQSYNKIVSQKPSSYPVEDCDNNTTIPYDDQLFLQSSPIHQGSSNHFLSSWTGFPVAPTHITPLRPSIIRRPTIPSSFNTRPPPPTTSLQTPQHFSLIYPSLQTSTPSTSSSATSISTGHTVTSTISTAVSTSIPASTTTTSTGSTTTTTSTGSTIGTVTGQITTAPTSSTSTISSGRTVQPPTNIFNMSSILKIEKFKGDNTQNPETWLTNFNQYCSFYDLTKKKSAESFPFHLEGHAKIWYDTVSDSKKHHFDFLIAAFKDRFKDKQHLLDITILQTHQGRNESVLDFLSRLLKLATNRNISDDILLAVAMNGLKADLKTIVMTKEPKNIEEFRHAATLAEKLLIQM
ncbi:unnamed protein product [Mytilus edulis]|uniref:Retrotransposon gag domain-containing protein n=1 Tax=Mytilus edulis TaxID=6550 RepID=A0A8S3ULC4_MYTED|nr:unnamed protein product [Mytilus edulis]